MRLGQAAVALLDTPTGFALFSVNGRICSGPQKLWTWFIMDNVATEIILFLEYIKVDDKSAVMGVDGPGERLAYSIRRHCKHIPQLVVEDENLRAAIIKSNLGVDCYDDKDVIHELMWGLRNMMPYFVRKETHNSTREYLLPLCQGFKDCVNRFGISISAEAIDKNFIAYVGSLDRCDAILKHAAKTVRETCDKLVPDIGRIIEDDKLYAEVMAKILTPIAVIEWHPSIKRLPVDVVQKIEAADTAADDAREQVDYDMFCLINECLRILKLYPGWIKELLQKIKRLVDKSSGRQKRSRTVVAGQASDDCSCANGVCAKKLRAVKGKLGVETLGDLLLSKESADITFEVGGDKFSAHQSVLAARSTVFKAQLIGAINDDTTASSVVKIDDMKANVFRALLTFIYTEEIPKFEIADKTDDTKEDETEQDWLLQLLEAAERYDLQWLKSICEEKLGNTIREDTVADIIVVAERRRCPWLKAACLDFIETHTSLHTVFTAGGLEKIIRTCSPSVLKELISKFQTYIRG
ncbi:uncharacterized protein [Triticum aestivum]|uniref:uncharacterized protein n=1 Tax=Triticum aestivum TaxID=4565 RepID=UPI000844F1F6|nr:uncharacterized protein LOC123133636 [Triticum aestivum]XP_044445610.1 uncharacterized protein LOC123172746 [Triticum aestivum]XP_044446323.1 uncharacterized protein LOC123175938 [Triticum aestivum]